MALFNEILVGRFNRWVQKFYAIKSGTASLTQLLPSVQTVAPIMSGNEDRYLQGWQRFMVTQTVNAVAAQFSAIQLRNPPGSNLCIVIEKINVLPGAVTLCRIFLGATAGDFATIIPTGGARIDARGNQGSAAIFSSGTTGGLSGTNVGIFRELATTTFPETPFIVTQNQELTILPGDAILVEIELVNTQCSFALMWRERPLESSELT